MSVQIWAHRGASAAAPENTLDAFERAVADGADGVELDVRLSADDVPVVIHDGWVDRVSGEIGMVSALSLARLKELDVSRPVPGWGTARIPTLAEVYALLRPTRLLVNVEIKGGLPDTAVALLLALERKMGMRGRVRYSAFSPYPLLALRAFDPHAAIGLLYIGGWIDAPQFALRIGADALHPPVYALEEPGFAAECERLGLALHVWGIDADDELLRARQSRVAAVVVDDPAHARTVLETLRLHPVN